MFSYHANPKIQMYPGRQSKLYKIDWVVRFGNHSIKRAVLRKLIRVSKPSPNNIPHSIHICATL